MTERLSKDLSKIWVRPTPAENHAAPLLQPYRGREQASGLQEQMDSRNPLLKHFR